MDRNFFIALAVSLLVYVGYSYFFVPQEKPLSQQQLATQTQQPNQQLATETATPQNAATVVHNTQPVEEERFFELETKNATITFTTKGAAIKNFVYKDSNTNLDLTPFEGVGYFATLPNINFKPFDGGVGADIAFKAELAEGLSITKRYYISRDGKLNKLLLELQNKSDNDLDITGLAINMGPGLNTVKSEMSENSVHLRAVCAIKENNKKNLTVNKITAKLFKKITKLQETCENWLWAGIDNRYFLAVLIPQTWQPSATGFNFKEEYIYSYPSFYGLFGDKPVNGPDLQVMLPTLVKAGETLNYDSDFYIGPKDLPLLESLPYDLQRSIQFGFFGQLGKWARNLLEWLYKYTHNYGYAIIIMTFMIQLILLPLTYKQLKSSAVMQKIQPQMKVIQEKYKNDPAQAQRELMGLYKKYGANPLTGCLPLFIQMPIFFALFNALRTSWALHGSPFIWWIQDPYYVLPILMGVMMFVQQKITMPDMGKDNPSMAMMKWMPVFMTVIFLNFPAGLTLYWFISNCINFVINLVLKRRLAAA